MVDLFGSSGLWWGVLAAGLGLDEDLCGDLGDVDVLGGDLDLSGDGSLGVGKHGSLCQGVVGLGGALELMTLGHALPFLVLGSGLH